MATTHRNAIARRLAVLVMALSAGCSAEKPSEVPIRAAEQIPARTASARSTGRDAEKHFHDIARDIPGFAGYFGDSSAALVVLTTDTSRAAALRNRLSSLASSLDPARPNLEAVVRQAQFSFDSLAAWRDIVFERVLGVVEGVTLDYIDLAKNRVVIGVDLPRHPSAENEVMKQLSSYGIPFDAIQIRSIPPAQLYGNETRMTSRRPAASPLAANDSLTAEPLPLVAGYISKNSALVGNCSFGPTITRNGSNGVISVSHCTPTFGLDASSIQKTVSGTWTNIGSESVDPTPTACGAYFCRNSDASFFSINGGVSFRRGAIARTSGAVPSTWGTPGSVLIDQADSFWSVLNWGQPGGLVVGTTLLWKVGQSTGTTGGTYSASCLDFTVGVQKRSCSGATTTYSDDGDSGGPVVAPSQGIWLYGIVIGGNPGMQWTFFSHWSYVRTEIGGTIAEKTDITVTPSLSGTVVFNSPRLNWSVAVTNSPFPTYNNVRRLLWNANNQQFDDAIRQVFGPSTALTFTDTVCVNLYYGSTSPGDNVSWAAYDLLSNNHGVEGWTSYRYFRRSTGPC